MIICFTWLMMRGWWNKLCKGQEVETKFTKKFNLCRVDLRQPRSDHSLDFFWLWANTRSYHLSSTNRWSLWSGLEYKSCKGRGGGWFGADHILSNTFVSEKFMLKNPIRNFFGSVTIRTCGSLMRSANPTSGLSPPPSSNYFPALGCALSRQKLDKDVEFKLIPPLKSGVWATAARLKSSQPNKALVDLF